MAAHERTPLRGRSPPMIGGPGERYRLPPRVDGSTPRRSPEPRYASTDAGGSHPPHGVAGQQREAGGCDVLQFSAPMFYVNENELSLEIYVMRLGSMEGRVACDWFTEDASATSPLRYTHASGRLYFAEGECEKVIEVAVVNNSSWAPTLEFKIRLVTPENCALGLYLRECRVHIINDNTFPTDAYQAEIQNGAGSIKGVSEWRLFWEYCKLNYYSAGVRSWTCIILVFDQLRNFYILGSLWVGVYMVDTVFDRHAERPALHLAHGRYAVAVIIALWFVLPIAGLHLWDLSKARADIGSRSRVFLQRSLFRTFLNLSESSKQQARPADMIEAITRDAADAADGYVSLVAMGEPLGKIMMVILFIVLYQPDTLAILLIVGMPSLIFVFSAALYPLTMRRAAALSEKDLQIVATCSETCQKFHMIDDYYKRPIMNDIFALKLSEYTTSFLYCSYSRLNAQYATQWLAGIAIAVYILARTQSVLDGQLSLGNFLATITIFCTHLQDAMATLDSQMLVITSSFESMESLTVNLNLTTNLACWKVVSSEQRACSLAERASTLKEGMSFHSDMVPIRICGLDFSYVSDRPILENVHIEVPQGNLVAVVGPPSSGKATFLQLLAHKIFPTVGSIFVPPHLRVVQVSREPIFLASSALTNLTWGLGKVDIHEVRRAKDILRLLKMTQILDLVEEDERIRCSEEPCDALSDDASKAALLHDVFSAQGEPGVKPGGPWADQLNYTDQAKIHLARAIIANPEVLVLRRPLLHFDAHIGAEVLDVIVAHVRQRGLCLGREADGVGRRPRTVFFVPENYSQAQKADQILQLDGEKRTLTEVAKGAPLNHLRCAS